MLRVKPRAEEKPRAIVRKPGNTYSEVASWLAPHDVNDLADVLDAETLQYLKGRVNAQPAVRYETDPRDLGYWY